MGMGRSVLPPASLATAPPFWRARRRRIGRVLVALVGLALALVLAGLLYQFVATQLAYRRYPAPGETVAVAGHEMQLYCTGEGRGGRP